jgi:hypothetical protein
LQGRLEQGDLVTIAFVDGTPRHADGVYDRLDGGALETALEKQVERPVEQFLVALLALRTRWPPGAAALRPDRLFRFCREQSGGAFDDHGHVLRTSRGSVKNK